MKKFQTGFTAIMMSGVLVLASCSTDPYTGERKASNFGKGAGIGAVIGGIGGALIGGSNSRKGALIGAGIGAIAGGTAGYYMDRQERELREKLQNSGVQVVRDGDNIILNMPGNITFATDSAAVNANFNDVLESVVLVLKEYDKTYVDVLGHTDSTGSDAYNQQLSMQRAQSVSNVLQSGGVVPQRIIVRGLGETYPIADNGTASGRAMNRRVEIALSPVT